MEKNLRREGEITVEKQKTKGRFWYKFKTTFLRILGFALLFVVPIGTVVGAILLVYTFMKKNKFINKYKITGVCPVCSCDLYLSADSIHGIVDEKCDECGSELKLNLDKLTILEKFKGNINLYQDKKMNYMVNKEVDLDALRVKADGQQEKIDNRKKEERLATQELKHQRKKELAEIKFQK
jgi:hypothetical protein